MLYSRKAVLASIATIAITVTPGCECEGSTSPKPDNDSGNDAANDAGKKVGGKTEQEWIQEVENAKRGSQTGTTDKIDGKTKNEIIVEAKQNMIPVEDAFLKKDAVEKKLPEVLALLGIKDQNAIPDVKQEDIDAEQKKVDTERAKAFVAQYNHVEKLKAIVNILSKVDRKSFLKDCKYNDFTASTMQTFAKKCVHTEVKDVLKAIKKKKCSDDGTLDGDKFSCTDTDEAIDAVIQGKFDSTNQALQDFLFTNKGLDITNETTSNKCKAFLIALAGQQVGDQRKPFCDDTNSPCTAATANCAVTVIPNDSVLTLIETNAWENQGGMAVKCHHWPASEYLIGLHGLVISKSNGTDGDLSAQEANTALCHAIRRSAAFSKVMDKFATDLKSLSVAILTERLPEGKSKQDVKTQQDKVDGLLKDKYHAQCKKGLQLESTSA